MAARDTLKIVQPADEIAQAKTLAIQESRIQNVGIRGAGIAGGGILNSRILASEFFPGILDSEFFGRTSEFCRGSHGR
jgi:hypothetical protein